MANEEHGTRGRWIAVDVGLLHPSHPLHPHSRGQQACDAFALIDLIGLARWKDSAGLRRGELRASQRFLARRWNWSRSKVQRFLDRLNHERVLKLIHEHGRKPGRICILNYDSYQKPRSTNRSTSGSTNRSTSGSKEVPVQGLLPAQTAARARANGRSEGDWAIIETLVRDRSLAGISAADLQEISEPGRWALAELGGLPELKGADPFQFNRAAKRFPALCREAASRGGGLRETGERDRGRESAASADGRGRAPSRPDVTLPALQVLP